MSPRRDPRHFDEGHVRISWNDAGVTAVRQLWAGQEGVFPDALPPASDPDPTPGPRFLTGFHRRDRIAFTIRTCGRARSAEQHCNLIAPVPSIFVRPVTFSPSVRQRSSSPPPAGRTMATSAICDRSHRRHTEETMKSLGRLGPMFLLGVAAVSAVTCRHDKEETQLTTASGSLTLGDPVVTTAPFGAIPSSSSVGPAGAFTYSIPLKVPDGVAGVTPSLSLQYSSQAGNGPMGVGWSIGGLSSIKRCKRTVSNAGVATSLSAGDGVLHDSGPFCLDGEPLIPIGRDGSTIEFKAERTRFARITGTALTSASGKFLVQTRDGQIMEYNQVVVAARTKKGPNGAPSTTAEPYAWHLGRTRPYSALPANGILYTYEGEAVDGPWAVAESANAHRLISKIGFALGPSPSLREVRFIYSASRTTDPVDFFEDGFQVSSRKRLDRIEMWGPVPNGSGAYEVKLVWSYKLTYCYGEACSAGATIRPSRFTGRTLLRSVTLCDAQDGCLPPTTFEWNDETFPGPGQLTTDYEVWSSVPTDLPHTREFTRLTLADLNGDGRDDLVYGVEPVAKLEAPNSVNYVYDAVRNLRVRLSMDASGATVPDRGFGSPLTPNVNAVDPFMIRVGDINGDGRAELMLTPFGVGRLYEFGDRNDPLVGVPISKVPVNALYDAFDDTSAPKICVFWVLPCLLYPDLVSLADLNGDGTLDFFRNGVYLDPPAPGEPTRPTGPYNEEWLLMDAMGGVAARSRSDLWNTSGAPMQLTDLTGDGKSDFVFTKVVRRSIDFVKAIQGIRDDGTTSPLRSLCHGCLLSDINGDGLKDLVDLGTPRLVRVSRNTGRGFLPFVDAATLPEDQWGIDNPEESLDFAERMENKVLSADFDGDGREDLLLLDAGRAGPRIEPHLKITVVTSPMVLLLARDHGYVRHVLDATANLGRLYHYYGLWYSDNKKWPAASKYYSGTVLGDVDGDGLPEIVFVASDPGGANPRIVTIRGRRPLASPTTPPSTWPELPRRDVIVGVYDGLKQSAGGATFGERVRYADLPALTDVRGPRAFTPCTGSPAGALARCLSRGPLVVLNHVSDRAVTTTNGVEYAYEGARTDIGGRGFLGFDRVITTDRVAGRRTTYVYNLMAIDETADTTFDPPGLRASSGPGDFVPVNPLAKRIFPHVGSPVWITEVTGNLYDKGGGCAAGGCTSGPAHARCTAVVREHVAQGMGTYSVRTRRTIVNEAYSATLAPTEANYAALCAQNVARTVTTEVNEFDEFDNPKKVTTTVSAGTTTVRETKFNNYTSPAKWLLGQPRLVTTAATKGSSVVKTKARYEWGNTARLSDVWVLPPDAADDATFPASVAAGDGVSDADITHNTHYSYDAAGNISEIQERGYDKSAGTGVVVRKTSYKYESPSAAAADLVYPSQITNGLGWGVKLNYHPSLGVLLDETDANNVVTRHSYDGLGRWRGTAEGGGATRVLSYTAGALGSGSPYTRTITSSTDMVGTETVDYLGRTVARSRLLFDGSHANTLVAYNDRGLVDKRSLLKQASAQAQWTIFEYDPLGRPSKITDPTMAARSWKYPGAFQTEHTDAVGNLKTSLVDADGLLASTSELVTSNLTTTQSLVRTRFTYDAAGRPLTVGLGGVPAADPKYTRNMTYDVLGRLRTVDDPAAGNVELRYNAFGEIRWSDEGGEQHRIGHDVLGRRTARTPGAVFVWDPPPFRGVLGRSDFPSLAGIIRRDYEYDSAARPAGVTVSELAGSPQTVQRSYRVGLSYDGNGRLDVISYPDKIGTQAITNPMKIQYQYLRGHLWKAQAMAGTLSSGARNLWLLNTSSPTRLETRTFDGTIDRIDYDLQTGRPTRVGIGNIESFTYDYFPNGDLKSRQAQNLDVDEMEYDSLGRLEIVRHTSGSGATSFRREHSYDDFGSLTDLKTYDNATAGSLVESRRYTLGFTNPATGRLNPYAVASESGAFTRSYTYNGRGQRASITENGTTHALTYNRFSLLDSVTRTAPTLQNGPHYRYDARGGRFSKTEGEVSSYYLDDLFEHREGGGWGRSYIYNVKAGGQVVALVRDVFPTGSGTPTRTVTYPHRDVHGSVVAVTGAGAQRFYYDPFGERVTDDGKTPAAMPSSLERHGFTGHEHEDWGGLIFMKGRIYDPTSRRFLTPDPFVHAPGLSQGWNSYSYVLNNPLRYTDPSGFEARRFDPDNDCHPECGVIVIVGNPPATSDSEEPVHTVNVVEGVPYTPPSEPPTTSGPAFGHEMGHGAVGGPGVGPAGAGYGGYTPGSSNPTGTESGGHSADTGYKMAAGPGAPGGSGHDGDGGGTDDEWDIPGWVDEEWTPSPGYEQAKWDNLSVPDYEPPSGVWEKSPKPEPDPPSGERERRNRGRGHIVEPIVALPWWDKALMDYGRAFDANPVLTIAEVVIAAEISAVGAALAGAALTATGGAGALILAH
jgi:RHS repeat-associated protein